MDRDYELNRILRARDIPTPSSNLAYRICQLAKENISAEGYQLSFMAQALTMFVIPKPAYVTAICLLFGLAVGFYSDGSDTSMQEWLLFLETEEGDWL